MMSLPLAFGADIQSIPSAPYLRGDVGSWRDFLSQLPGRRIGLCWAGRSNMPRPEEQAMDARRPLHLTQLLPILRVPGCSFVSLTIGPAAAQIAEIEPGLIWEVSDRIRDYADTAGLIEGLDLVITVDTAVAHLADALGRPVWMLDRMAHCWRWLRGGVRLHADLPAAKGRRLGRCGSSGGGQAGTTSKTKSIASVALAVEWVTHVRANRPLEPS